MKAGVEAVADSGRSRANTIAEKCLLCSELQNALDDTMALANQMKSRNDQGEAEGEILRKSVDEMNKRYECIGDEQFKTLIDCASLALRYHAEQGELERLTIMDAVDIIYGDDESVTSNQVRATVEKAANASVQAELTTAKIGKLEQEIASLKQRATEREAAAEFQQRDKGDGAAAVDHAYDKIKEALHNIFDSNLSQGATKRTLDVKTLTAVINQYDDELTAEEIEATLEAVGAKADENGRFTIEKTTFDDWVEEFFGEHSSSETHKDDGGGV